MTKRIVIRTCCACRHKGEKSGFVRVVRTPDKKVLIDRMQKISGRGVYVCPNPACIDKAFKIKAIERTYRFMADVPKDIYERLKEECR